MKNLKKVLSLVLALAMALSLMTVAFAADESNYADYDEVTYNEAVDVMSAVGVFDGMGGSFNPDGTLTREQAAKIITYMLMGKTNADKLTTTIAPYGDVSASRWSAGAIAYCTNEGIISGMGHNKFAPSDEVTGLQFAKMLLVAIGYDAEIEEMVGDSWAINTSKLAIAVGLDDGMEEVSLSGKLTREQACQMAFNAMQTPLVEYASKGTTIEVNGATVSFGAQKASYVTTTIAKTQTISDTKLSNSNDYLIEFAEQYCQKLVLDGDNNALEQPVRVWSYDGDEIGTYATDADKIAVVADKNKTIDDVLLGSSYMNYSARDIAVSYTTGSGNQTQTHYDVYVNGQQKDTANYGATALTKGDVVYAYENNDGDVYKVVVARYTYAKIDSVATNMSTTEKDNGAAYRVKLVDIDDNAAGTYYDDYDNEAKVINGFNASTYKEDVVLAVAVNPDNKAVVDSYVAKTVTGKPSAVKEGINGSITVDGTKYDFAGTPAGVSTNFDFDNEYAVYTTAEGYAIAIAGVTSADVNDLYYVTGVYSKSSAYGETDLVYYAQRVSLADGSMDTVQVEKGALQVIGKNTTVTSNSNITDNAAKAWAGLYTFNDKKVEAKAVNGGKSDEQKAGNEIYTLVPFASDAAITDDFGATNNGKIATTTVTGGVKIDATKIATSDSGSFYLNENTKYLAVESLGSDIDVAYAQGGMKVTTDPVSVIVVYNAEDGKTAAAVIYVGASLNTSVSTKDVVYLAAKPTSRASNDNWNATLWYMEDNTSKDVVLDDDYAQGFYVYSEKDGVLKLESADILTLTAAYDDEAGPVENLVIDETYQSSLFSTTANFFNDIRYNNVTIIDNRTQDVIDADLYDTEITTVADLKDAVKEGGSVVADIYFNDGATFIAVDSVGNRANDAVDKAEADGYTFVVAPVVDGNNVSVSANADYCTGDSNSDGSKDVTGDLARFLGGMYNSGAASTIEFNGVAYTWDPTSAGNLSGSNWYGNGKTLVKAIITDTWGGAANMTAGKTYTAELTVDGVAMTYTVVVR